MSIFSEVSTAQTQHQSPPYKTNIKQYPQNNQYPAGPQYPDINPSNMPYHQLSSKVFIPVFNIAYFSCMMPFNLILNAWNPFKRIHISSFPKILVK